MGVLPLQFLPGESVDSLGLTGHELFDIEGLSDDLQPQPKLMVRAVKPTGSEIIFQVVARLDTSVEIEYYRNGGILHTVLRKMLAEANE